MASIELLQQRAQLIGANVCEPIVVEAQVERVLLDGAAPAIGDELPHEGGLARTAHAGDCVNLVWNLGQRSIAAGHGGHRFGCQSRVEPLFQDGVQGHWEKLRLCPFSKDRLTRINLFEKDTRA